MNEAMSAGLGLSNDARYRKVLRGLGWVLLIGFGMPIIMVANGVRVVFANVEAITSDFMPGMVKFHMAWPLVAGIVLIGLSFMTAKLARGVLVLLLGFVPAIALLQQPGLGSGILSSMGMSGWAGLISMLALMLILTAAVSRMVMADSKLAAWLGCVSGVVYLVGLVLPTVPEPMRSMMGSMPLLMPFGMMRQGGSEGVIFGVGTLLSTLLLMGASAVSIMNVKDDPGAAGLARLTVKLLIASVVVGFAAAGVMMISVMGRFGQGMSGGMLLGILTSVIKGIFWAGGLMLVIPAGGVDVVTGLTEVNGGLRFDGGRSALAAS